MPLQIVRQDITKMKVDAIVNTTNEEMIGYSGVDFAVHQGAGQKLDKACSRIAPLGLGEAKITKGYNLDAKYIIHTSGPVWRGGLEGESIILKSCYTEALKIAVSKGLKSIAFPLISSGAYGYPKDKVLKFAVQVITEFLCEHELAVYLCVFDKKSYEFSKTLFEEICNFIEGKLEDQVPEKCRAYKKALQPMVVESRNYAEVCSTHGKMQSPCREADESLHDYMKKKDKSFAYKLFDLIDERGMTDVECYKKANVDKKTFSKIKCKGDTYRPSKQTAVAFAIALKLDLEETQDLLASAGLTLSYSFTFDKIIMYFIQKEIYNIFEINEALFEFDQVLLGV
ncbi:MAG: macro domain-containing protein [Clostridia bacterium]|nr:macro domain-containing protein [Clostridia bacterium]